MNQNSEEQFNKMLSIFDQLIESSEQNTFDEFEKKHKFKFEEDDDSDYLPSLDFALSTAPQTNITEIATSTNNAKKPYHF